MGGPLARKRLTVRGKQQIHQIVVVDLGGGTEFLKSIHFSYRMKK
jgi:hypothetical protein